MELSGYLSFSSLLIKTYQNFYTQKLKFETFTRIASICIKPKEFELKTFLDHI